MFYELMIRPLLFNIFRKDPETAHELALHLLGIVGEVKPLRQLVANWLTLANPRLETELFGLTFPNPIGLAAGFDKNAVALPGLEALGFGFIEIGTVTQYAQSGNLRPRMFRFPKNEALINRMGFNNDGCVSVANRLKGQRKLGIPLGISLGKSKVTPIVKAAEDYAISLIALYEFADYFVVNVSSPNTPGLRSLQDKDPLKRILNLLSAQNRDEAKTHNRLCVPMLVKIAPDLTVEAIDELLEVCAECGIDGIIATNTTLSRDGLSVETAETGGMSGHPIFQMSLDVVRHIRKVDPKIPIIGVGGIDSPDRAYEMLEAGANLLQIYSSFVYGGPRTVRNLNEGLLALMNQHEADNIQGI